MSRYNNSYSFLLFFGYAFILFPGTAEPQTAALLPEGVKAVWDLKTAYRETTSTRERICINGLWQFQPVVTNGEDIPSDGWGYIKVPAPWPVRIGDYMWRETQKAYPHPKWENAGLDAIHQAWYQREISIPEGWSGRRVTLSLEYLNSYAAIYIDGKKMGEVYFPGGELDITPACQSGVHHRLTVFTAAMPLKAVIQSYSDTNAARQIEGKVERRGLCGDAFLVSTPPDIQIADVKVEPSVRKGEIGIETEIHGLRNDSEYTHHVRILDGDKPIEEFDSPPFTLANIKNGRFVFVHSWKPEKLWDIHTSQNQYDIQVSLFDAAGKPLDEFQLVRFGFREFWIEGRDFWLNGSRIFCFAVPLDNAQVSAAAASYAGTRETLRRLKTFGVNAVYTHNYGCEPGSHLGFSEILQAADDEGMLVFFSQPHFAHYDWKAPDAGRANGYARHAEFFVRQAQNHPSVVMYAMSHNATGYNEDMNPDLIDGIHEKRDTWASNNAKQAVRAEEIVRRFDRTRIVYHHAGGNLGSMHTSNFYLNFVPIQERSDWFEHWATVSVKPLFLCEYGAPWGINWTMYRGWYEGKRDFGSAQIPWQFCMAEWNSQFLGDSAFRLTEMDKENLRFESKQALAGKLWHRWDYPYPVVGSYAYGDYDRERIWAMYIQDNWKAFRTWGVSGFNVWSFSNFWMLREGVDRSRKNFEVEWDRLQTPGYSPDFIDRRFDSIDLAYEFSDWIPTAAAKALIQNNQPILSYIAGKCPHFTGKDHHFNPGQTVEKQIVVINNSRETVTGECTWSLSLPQAMTGKQTVRVETGQQELIPLSLILPSSLMPGEYNLEMSVRFNTGQIQSDTFSIRVLPLVSPPPLEKMIALFDPRGETAHLLESLAISCSRIEANADLSPYDILIVGKAALTMDGPAPDIARVRDGLKVLVFEQTSESLEKRLGFRVQEYGLRKVFTRVPDHPVLAGLSPDCFRDWNGESTITPPRLDYESRPMHGPTIRWCGIEVTRPWRCGCRGNVASVLVEKPAIGDFLPILDGGFNLQYSPLMEYREGDGVILFCQMDVTGRTEDDPAALQLVANLLAYISSFKPSPQREAIYIGDPAGQTHFEKAGFSMPEYKGEGLQSNQVLVVGPGGGSNLSPYKTEISAWLNEGGHLLAVGLNKQDTDAFLPFDIGFDNREYIDTFFESAGLDSLLVGIGPADALIREPRPLPLLTGGVRIVGDGVLAYGKNANAVFSQLVPWQFDYDTIFHRKMTFRRTSFLLTRLLSNMGIRGDTPLLSRFSVPLEDGTNSSSPPERWLTGLYLDKPEEMDDPYRFFRW